MTLKHVILTGVPGVGKTTLVKQVIKSLQSQNIGVRGFYTEEERNSDGKRIGFNIITVDGQKGPLASTSSSSTKRVGQYGVEIDQFEKLAIPELRKHGESVVIIDEIGKMELFSNPFKQAVTNAFDCSDLVILATIPIPKGKPIELVEKIRTRSDAKLFTVDRSNRNSLQENILTVILDAIKNRKQK